MDAMTAELATERHDLEEDLHRVRTLGPDQLDVVAFADLEAMGAPINLSTQLRHRIYHLAVTELEARLERLHRQINGPVLSVAR